MEKSSSSPFRYDYVLFLELFYSMSCAAKVQESAHLFGDLPKGLIVFGFSLYAALASLSFSILSTCSLHFLLLPRDYPKLSGIPSHRSRISLLFCLSLSVMPAIALFSVVLSALFVRLCLLSLPLRR